MSKKIDFIYKSILTVCKRKNAKKFLYLISFFESIIFPFPTDPFLVPYILAEKKFIKLTIYVTLFSVLGGLVGYCLGYFLWENILLYFNSSLLGVSSLINDFKEEFSQLGVLLVLIGGFSPFPYKVTCLASGILGINIFIFLFFSFLSRGSRFFIVSYLIFKYGEYAINLAKKNIMVITFIIIYFFLIVYLMI